MAGIRIYLTEQEQNMLIKYTSEAVGILGEAEDTYEETEKDMENGLGSALYKLYEGRTGQMCYEDYKRKKVQHE